MSGEKACFTPSKILRLREKNDSIERDIWGNRALMRVMCVRCDYRLVDSSLPLAISIPKNSYFPPQLFPFSDLYTAVYYHFTAATLYALPGFSSVSMCHTT